MGHILSALFYCNPLILILGDAKCTPYDDRAGTKARTNIKQMGYPYNYEPLNFLRAAGSAVSDNLYQPRVAFPSLLFLYFLHECRKAFAITIVCLKTCVVPRFAASLLSFRF